MSRNDHRITETAIEAEMLRLASLLSEQVRPSIAHTALTRQETLASNATLKKAVLAFTAKV